MMTKKATITAIILAPIFWYLLDRFFLFINNAFLGDGSFIAGFITIILPWAGIPLAIWIGVAAFPEPPPVFTPRQEPPLPEPLTDKGDYPTEETPEFDRMVSADEITVMPTYEIEKSDGISYGSANFLRDAKKQMTSAKEDGLWLGGGYFHHKEGNLITASQPGGGKGAAIILPNLLWPRSYKHSFVVFDPKGTNAAVTAHARELMGQKILILDPTKIHDETNENFKYVTTYNPLDFVKGDIVNGCTKIARLLLPDDPKSTDKIWIKEARELIQGLLMHVMTSNEFEDNRNLAALYKYVRRVGWKEILADLKFNDHLDGEIKDVAKKLLDLLDTNEKGFGSVVFSSGEALNWIKGQAIQSCLKTSGFSPSDIVEGDHTLYLCVPVDMIEDFGVWARIIIGQLGQENYKAFGTRSWVYYMLDEFPSMGQFPEIIRSMTLGREYKMRTWLFVQNLSQLNRIYTHDQTNEIIGLCGVFQSFAISDPFTAKYVSERIGKKTIRPEFSSSTIGRDILQPNEVQMDDSIVTFTENGVFRLKKWFYWKKPKDALEQKYYDIMNKNAKPNPNYTKE
jgi:type IV secretion system protein VirD4